MRKRAHRIATITVIASLCVLFSTSDLSANFGYAFFYAPVAVTSAAAVLINYNVGTSRSDNPSKFGGISGILVGGLTAAYGGVVIFL